MTSNATTETFYQSEAGCPDCGGTHFVEIDTQGGESTIEPCWCNTAIHDGFDWDQQAEIEATHD